MQSAFTAMHSTSPGHALPSHSPDVIQVMRGDSHSLFAANMTQSALQRMQLREDSAAGGVVSSIQLMDRNAASDSDEKIYDDPYELMMGDDDWIGASPVHGGGGPAAAQVLPRSRSWLCCPNSTSSTVVAGGGEEWRRRNDIIRGEYSSLVTTQPARGNDASVNAMAYRVY